MDNAPLPYNTIKILMSGSLPDMTCSHKRQGKVATVQADKGNCATKDLNYHGVKLHTLGLFRASALPVPQYVGITEASFHDLTAYKETLQKINAEVFILDEAYQDKGLAKPMQENNSF